MFPFSGETYSQFFYQQDTLAENMLFKGVLRTYHKDMHIFYSTLTFFTRNPFKGYQRALVLNLFSKEEGGVGLSRGNCLWEVTERPFLRYLKSRAVALNVCPTILYGPNLNSHFWTNKKKQKNDVPSDGTHGATELYFLSSICETIKYADEGRLLIWKTTVSGETAITLAILAYIDFCRNLPFACVKSYGERIKHIDHSVQEG